MLRKVLPIFALLLLAVFVIAHAQDKQSQDKPAQDKQGEEKPAQKKPPASPRGQASVSFDDGKKITVDYGRPYAKGRKIMGGLVPYGQVWRTGANAATGFETDAPITVGGTAVPAGKYTMYTLPGENEWKIIISKQTGQWGTEYNEPQDLARISAKPGKTAQPVEQFTISFDKRGASGAVMKLEWENTSVAVDIKEAK